MSDSPDLPAQYLRSLLLTTGVLVGLCLGLNLLVDPLWHFSGNRLTGQNMGFNERLSKLNRGARIAAQKDCVIYGSSRGTLLDESLIKDFDCLNMAVSEGQAIEFPHYADYLIAHGLHARRLIINADDLSFFSRGGNNAPAFVQGQGEAPAWWQDYLSLDALEFSIRALLGKSPTPRYYQEDFSITIEQGRRTYRPRSEALVSLDQVPAARDQARRLDADFLAHYRALIARHEGADSIIYVPPISVWRLGDMIRRGELPDYLDAIHALTQLGVPVLDFSVPSAVTADPALTYDGSHFSLAVNRRIAGYLKTQQCGPCLAVHEMNAAEYQQSFRQRYRDWRTGLLAAELNQ